MEEPNEDIVLDKILPGEAAEKFKSSDVNGDESGMSRLWMYVVIWISKFIIQIEF